MCDSSLVDVDKDLDILAVAGFLVVVGGVVLVAAAVEVVVVDVGTVVRLVVLGIVLIMANG